MTYALDTGFFYELLTGPEPKVQGAWDEIGRGETRGVVSYVACFELYRHGLRGSLPKVEAEALLEDLPLACAIVSIEDLGRTERAARLAHGNGLSMADAFILEAALDQDADRLYTSDTDFDGYEGGIEIILV